MSRRFRCMWLLLVGSIVWSVPSLAQDRPPIVENGEARAEIVLAEQPARMTQVAANELQTYIRKISGAELPVVTEPTGKALPIYVGVSPRTRELGLETEGLKYGAYRMDVGPDWLALLGNDHDFTPIEPWAHERNMPGDPERQRINDSLEAIIGMKVKNPYYAMYRHYIDEVGVWSFDDRGTLHAVHAYLRDLGVRWYLPGELGEVVPSQATITLPAEASKVVKPHFPLRVWDFWSSPWLITEEDALWRMRHGLHNGFHDILGIPQIVHGMKFVLEREEIRQNHPEYFALVAGERMVDHKRHGAPCLSSPEVFAMHVAYVRGLFDHYDEPMLSIDVVDGYSGKACTCDQCLPQHTPERGADGALSDFIWGYFNRVATEVYKTHPDKMVSAVCYGSYRLPPTKIERLSPNLAVFLMSPRQHFHKEAHRQGFAELLAGWKEILPSKTFYIFENLQYNRSKRGSFPLPVFYTDQSVAFIQAVKDDISGFIFSINEHRPWDRDEIDWHSLGVMHLDLHLMSHLWWDPETDIEPLLAEYYTLFYGPAEEPMREFIEYCAENHHRMTQDATVIDRALELIDKAEAAIDAESIYGRRVDMMAVYTRKFLPELRDVLTQERLGPQIVVPSQASDGLIIDGKLDEAFWASVPAVPMRENSAGGDYQPVSTLKMAWGDNNSLYLGIWCEESQMDTIIDEGVSGFPIFNGDNLDLVLETDVHNFYQIVVSPSGTTFEMDRSEMFGRRFYDEWSSGASIATHRGENGWSVEMQLPAAGAEARELDHNHGIAGDRPGPDAPWYFNIGRSRPRGGEQEFGTLVPTGDRHFHEPVMRAKLIVDESAAE